MNKDYLKEYAKLAVKTGVNIQKGQKLFINSPIECNEFTRLIAECAYDAGAREVIVNWNDEKLTKLKYTKAPFEVFLTMPEWEKEMHLSNLNDGAAFLAIHASDPELLKDVDPNVISTAQKTRSKALKEYNEKIMSNKNAWSVISIPTKAWASKVFPNLSTEDAVEELWKTIFNIVRVDTKNPITAWNEHLENLKSRLEFLNSKHFRSLHYKNSLGTDLTVELPQNHLWLGGSEHTQDNIEFLANMPTEEIFSAPLKHGVNGTLFSSKPLNHGGNLINNFSFSFENGKVVSFTAEEGYESLKHLIETDEGSCYLGEIALVPFDSPISNSNIIFFNTLYDENASCHFALGKAYSVCVKDGENMTKEELNKVDINDSLTHVDFMVGTSDLSIIGTTENGETVEVFKNGNWAF